ncbi:MAG: hypothetical protein GIKADHBN_02282 [Phycisphaerales bacterium]|nr:hypothetical protein [Phycisphaerales bacterium]
MNVLTGGFLRTRAAELVAFVGVATLAGSVSMARAQAIVDLGLLPGGTWSFASECSADGTVVVGTGDSGGQSRAWRWTQATGLVSLGVAPGMTRSSGYRVSGDGLVVTGVSGSSYDVASRWTAQTGMVSLGSLAPGKPSFAFGTNFDGSIVVGDGYLADGSQRAFRWTSAGGLAPFGQRLAGCNNSLALTVNHDATLIAGYCYNNAPALVYPTACVWDAAGTVTSLGVVAGKEESVPGAVSADGSVVVGYCADGTGQNTCGFRWTATGGMQEISYGTLGTVLGSVSGNGSIAAGYYRASASSVRGLIWTASDGPQDIEAYLNARGISTAGWNLRKASVSADGKTLFGWGIRNGASTTWYVAQGCVAPHIDGQPSNQTAVEGSPASFTVVVTGSALQYQWFKDGSVITGATAATYTIPQVTFADEGLYACDVWNECGSATSTGATLTVVPACDPATIVGGPVDSSTWIGGSAEFSVAASGTAPLTYQWSRDGEILIDGQAAGHAVVSGSSTAWLSLVGVQEADAGYYLCEVTNDCGSSSGGAMLTLTSGCDPADVISGPFDAATCPGGATGFAVTATGTGPLFYQWSRNGEPLVDGASEGHAVVSGSATANLTLTGVESEDAGIYECEVTNDCGSSTVGATLAVCGADHDCSGFVDLEDFTEFVADFEAGDDDADFDGSGFVDTDDFDAFVRAFEAGC